ncbi:MAG TPA: hypothetical protein HA362_02245 [Nanoarchaeota archaeon]|nr:hypothetical protein [Nanoarchaeota archaeon]
MLNNISYYLILGRPLIFYLGLLTLTSLLTTATLGALVIKGRIKFKYHKALAITTVCIALTHGTLAFLAYL